MSIRPSKDLHRLNDDDQKSRQTEKHGQGMRPSPNEPVSRRQQKKPDDNGSPIDPPWKGAVRKVEEIREKISRFACRGLRPCPGVCVIRHWDMTSFLITVASGLALWSGGGLKLLSVFACCYITSLVFSLLFGRLGRISPGFSDDLDDAARFLGPVRATLLLILLCLFASGPFQVGGAPATFIENLTAAAGLLSAFVDLRTARKGARFHAA